MVTGGGQWVVDLLDDLIMKYPTPLVSVLFGSIIPTFCLVFVIVFILEIYTVFDFLPIPCIRESSNVLHTNQESGYVYNDFCLSNVFFPVFVSLFFSALCMWIFICCFEYS